MRMFVGNLDFDTSHDELVDAFLQYGSVTTAVIMMNGTTGEPHGYGFVEMETDAEAQAAARGLDGSSLRGRQIMVSLKSGA